MGEFDTKPEGPDQKWFIGATPPLTIVLISPLQLVELVAKTILLLVVIGVGFWTFIGGEVEMHPKSSIIVYL